MMMFVRRLLSRLPLLLGLKSRWHRHFSSQPLNKVFFQGAGVGGFVDSWPETLVPSASNRSTAEWTLVDSVDCRQGRFDPEQLRDGTAGEVRGNARKIPRGTGTGGFPRRWESPADLLVGFCVGATVTHPCRTGKSAIIAVSI